MLSIDSLSSDSAPRGRKWPSRGASDGCPVCRTTLAAELSEPIAERQCPRCEAGLWALALTSGLCSSFAVQGNQPPNSSP